MRLSKWNIPILNYVPSWEQSIISVSLLWSEKFFSWKFCLLEINKRLNKILINKTWVKFQINFDLEIYF